MSRQNADASRAPGIRAAIPTTAIGTDRRAVRAPLCEPDMAPHLSDLSVSRSGQQARTGGERLAGHRDAVGAQLVGARYRRGAFEEVERDLHDGPPLRGGQRTAGHPAVE